MKYELNLFDRIISGDLSPFSDSLHQPQKYEIAIKEKHPQCYNYIIASFKTGSKTKLLDKKIVNALHPVINKIIAPQQNLFEVKDIEHIAPDAYKILKLNKEEIVSVSYARQPQTTTIFIKQVSTYDTMPTNEVKYYYYTDILNDEYQRIKLTINDAALSLTNNEELAQYVHIKQNTLVSLSFRLLKLMDLKNHDDIYRDTSEYLDIDILKLVFIKIEKLLRLLEKNYFDFLNRNVKIPMRSSVIDIYKIDEKLQLVKSTLLSLDICPNFLKIIYAPILRLASINIEERITYNDFIYINTYLQAFYEGIKENGNTLNEGQILDVLYRINYNSFDVQFAKTKIIQEEVEKIIELSDKIDYLYRRLKLVNQRQTHINIAFDKSLPSLKDQITTWIEEEINYLTKKLQLVNKQPENNLFSTADKVKLETGLTVAQLAMFFKLQADVGIITTKIQRDIFRHISENYKTSNTVEISQTSVKNKYYNFDETTIEVLKQKTIEILNHLKEH